MCPVSDPFSSWTPAIPISRSPSSAANPLVRSMPEQAPDPVVTIADGDPELPAEGLVVQFGGGTTRGLRNAERHLEAAHDAIQSLRSPRGEDQAAAGSACRHESQESIGQ